MKLVIDIGNTSVTCGLFKNQTIVKKLNCNSPKLFESFLIKIKKNTIIKIIISSVVPKYTNDYLLILKKHKQENILIINHKNSHLKLNVLEPSTVGADRLCNIKATIKLYKHPSIIVDFGTATTYDVINNKKEFIGGAIATGIETSAEYLIKNAALLSKTDLEFPDNVVGIDTKENIQSGIMFGAVDQVEGMIKRIQKETNENYNIILTGGLASTISPYLKLKHILDPDLTLKGMLYIDESSS